MNFHFSINAVSCRRIARFIVLAPILMLWTGGTFAADPPKTKADSETPIREIFVPFEDLNVLLESNTNHVFLTRQQYSDLIARAKQTPLVQTPTAATVLSARYEATVETGRVMIDAAIEIDVLRKGLQVVPLALERIGVLEATLDGSPAAIGKGESGDPSLFVEGIGRHTLKLRLVAALSNTTTQQTFTLQLPTPPATSFYLTGPGNVQMADSTQVVSQRYDADTDRSRLQLLISPGINQLAMGIGNRQMRQQSVVVARSVLVAEVTESYQRLHATVSMEVLHGGATEFRFAMPAGFDVTHVDSPLMSKFEISEQEGESILIVSLRQAARGTEVFSITAEKSTSDPIDPNGTQWTAPQLVPIDVAGVASVVGVLLDGRLDLQSLQPEGLIPIDTAVITAAIPPSVFEAEPGAPLIRPVAAYYAAQREYGLTAAFRRPPATVQASTNLLLTLSQQRHAIRGQYSVSPTQEKLFQIRFRVPPQWHVTEVTDGAQQPLEFEALDSEQDSAGQVVRVRLAHGIAPGERSEIRFRAVHTPDKWLDGWQSTSVEFPRFELIDVATSVGAIAVRAIDDMTVQTDALDQLVPLDDKQKGAFGLNDVQSDLAFEFDQPQWSAQLTVERLQPNITAESFTFFKVQPDGIFTHGEIVYDVTQAGARTLSFFLPAEAPETLNIRGSHGAVVKEFSSELLDNGRRWTARLAAPTVGVCRLIVDFQDRLADDQPKGLVLPIPRADGVRFQTALVAVEGHGELDVQIDPGEARPVDVGKLAGADYLVGRRLLGAFGFLGDPGTITVDVFRRDGYGLPPVIVQRAELVTLVGTHGSSQTAARYQLGTKASYLEAVLPTGATLWSVRVDGKSAKPQKQGTSLLVSLPEGDARAIRDLQIVYATPIRSTGAYGRFRSDAPRLYLRDDSGGRAGEVPVADLKWHLELPAGFVIADEAGTVRSGASASQPLPIRNALSIIPASRIHARHRTSTSIDMSAAPAEVALGMASGLEEPSNELKAAMEIDSDAAADLFDAAPVAAGAALQQAIPTPKAEAAKRPQIAWALEGVGSLEIEVDRPTTGQRVTLTSLGAAPQVDATIVDSHRLYLLGLATMILVGLGGLLLTLRSSFVHVCYVLGVLFFANLIPVAFGLERELSQPATLACQTAFLLGLLYLGVACFRWGRSIVRGPVVASCLLMLGFAIGIACPASAQVADPTVDLPNAIDLEKLASMLADERPITLPEGAVIVPYQADAGADGFRQAEKVLVPYKTYVQLWNQAFPDKAIDKPPVAAEYALAGAKYQTRLDGDGFLMLRGELLIDLFSDQSVTIPLPIEGVVFEQAHLDGKAARMRLVAAKPTAEAGVNQVTQQADPAAGRAFADRSLMTLEIEGKGRHSFEFVVRLNLQRTGGWRVAAGRIPVAAAAQIEVVVPAAGTEVRLTGVNDREQFETTAADESIVAALKADGRIAIQWRPRVALGEVDESLTARSAAVMDVQEDGLRVVWQLELSFPRSRRSELSLEVPDGFQIQGVHGANVRDWSVVPLEGRQRVDVTLLKEAVGEERLAIVLAQPTRAGDRSKSLQTPAVGVVGAVLHTGIVQIRRSPLLDVVAAETIGVARTDIDEKQIATLLRVAHYDESPLGIRPFQAYSFNATPFTLSLTAAPIEARGSATLQTILRITERKADVECRVEMQVHDRPTHRIRLRLPADFEIDDVSAPCDYQWSTTAIDGDSQHRLMSIFLAEGLEGNFAIVVRGGSLRDDPQQDVALPAIQVLDVQRQQGEIAIQIDPAYSAVAADLENCTATLRGNVNRWLQADQRRATTLAIAYRQPEYSGIVRVTPQQAIVKGRTFTNVRVTQRAIEELIVIALDVSRAGIREYSFLLPARLADATIQQASLRRKTIAAVAERPDYVRVTIQLQDDMMGQVRALVRQTRLLDDAPQTIPIPILETGQTIGRFATLENDGRDEVVIDEPIGMEPLGRLHSQRRVLTDVLGASFGDAFVVDESASAPQLGFRTHQRAEVRTAGASIGKAETVLVVDDAGTYRAAVEYRINNDTEQFLEIELPRDARLWTASVAGEPVKPTLVPGAASQQNVRIPLVKTAEGDTDYGVVLKYGGAIDLNGLRSRVEFPLVHTTNIHVEISQVRLLLPESHRWYGFDGTMQRVNNEGDYRALDLKHLTQQFRMLSSALSSKNEYSKVRAETNLKKLGRIVEAHQNDYAEFYEQSEAVRKELDLNSITQQQAAEQVVENRRKADQMLCVGNSDQLQSYFDRGSNSRSRRVVDQLGEFGNFSAAQANKPGKHTEGRESQTFNRDWFAQNGLAMPQEPAAGKDAKAKGMEQTPRLQTDPRSQREADKNRSIDKSALPALRFDDAQPEAPRAATQDRRGLRDDVSRYSQQLKREQSPSPQTSSPQRSISPRGGGMGGGGFAYEATPADSDRYRGQPGPFGDPQDPFGGNQTGQTDPFAAVPDAPAQPQTLPNQSFGRQANSGMEMGMGMAFGEDARSERLLEEAEGFDRGMQFGDRLNLPPATGAIASNVYLASLETELPLDRGGQEYFFSAPRGEIEITAQAIPSSSLRRGVRLAAMGLLFGGFLIATTLVRRHNARHPQAA
ncbi:hypothetical protein EC9_22050 [Rosistilla ulvae]|uniref:Uncharacterized protein n=1 Tax=Rosistilla ulvae TaxID=1930277 RepID=A0A517LZH9_9BACT|nr:hypothetical protein [Rosistilla ulvae]QDS88019.1 hypothetical protein EC9_22050 [Rosistilla ulvae]